MAQAYADGYRNGYNDCKAEREVVARNLNTEYVDLGLPSGTLWAADYEKDNNCTIYASYETALQFSLPTKEQVCRSCSTIAIGQKLV